MYSIVDKKPELGIALYKTNVTNLENNIHRIYNDVVCELKRKETTWLYYEYNIFSFTYGYKEYHELFKDINGAIREFVRHNDPLWFQCWLNYHNQDEVLDWHDHKGGILHGYVAIDPKNTTTEYEQGFGIDNEPGYIFIGKTDTPDMRHRVVVNEPFEGPRITLGFDVYDSKALDLRKEVDQQSGHLISRGLFPLL